MVHPNCQECVIGPFCNSWYSAVLILGAEENEHGTVAFVVILLLKILYNDHELLQLSKLPLQVDFVIFQDTSIQSVLQTHIFPLIPFAGDHCILSALLHILISIIIIPYIAASFKPLDIIYTNFRPSSTPKIHL